MKQAHRCCSTALCVIFFLAIFSAPTIAGQRNATLGLDNHALQPGGQPYLPGVVIVKFVQQLQDRGTAKVTGAPELDAILARHDVKAIEPFAPGLRGPGKAGRTDLSRIYFLRFESGTDALTVAREIAVHPGVEYAEPQFIYSIDATPNDPLYASAQSAYFNRMSLPAAFDSTKGEDGHVVVAIVDGGTDWDHPDLLANLWSNPNETLNGLDDDNNGYIDDVRGWNFANATNDPTGLPQTPSSAHHGTHVAGIACAHTNNAVGVAGASWNATYMPVCVAHPGVDNAILYGYQGILYAVENGADVINCSWGGLGNPSNFEQEVIDFAWENGVAVVAAAGNNNTNQPHYPSSYDHVLSVANVGNTDIKVVSSNYGPDVDVSAQGSSIRSTGNGGTYLNASGTSMSSPHAAAVCALVKTRFPAFTADQVMQRVRVTSDNIDSKNPAYAGLLGFGRINALNALTMTTPAMTVTGVVVSTSDGDAIIEPAETVTLDITVLNHLDPGADLTFTLTETSSFATVSNGSASVTSLGTLQSVQLSSMTVEISASAPINHVIQFTLGISSVSPAYNDQSRFTLTVLPIIATHDANRVLTTVTSVGKLGFGISAGGTGTDGVGFVFDGGPNLLYEGALMIGTGPDNVSDAARGADGSSQDDDFQTAENGVPVMTEPAGFFAEYGVAAFTDALAAVPLGVFVRQESYEMSTAPNDGFLTVVYTVRNDSGGQLDNLYVGWYFDWDLDGANYGTNRTSYDGSRGLGFVWDDGNGPDTYVGIMTLTDPGTTSYRGIWNDENNPANPSWGVYDGYTDQEKWESLSAGVVFTDAGPADVSNSIGTGPFSLAAGDSVQVAFALLGGSNLAELQAAADAAQSLWDNPPTDTGDVVQPRPLRLFLSQNAPNPFNPNTTIAFDLPRTSDVLLQIYNVRGGLVRTLIEDSREAGSHRVSWDGFDDDGHSAGSGTYFYRLSVNGRSMTRKMQLLK